MWAPASVLAIEAGIVAGAALLLYAGSTKVVAPAAVRSTLGDLGIPGHLTAKVAGAVALAEIVTAVVVVTVRGYTAALLLPGLGTTFAAAGLWSLATGRRIACNCFGPHSGRAVLGWRQVAYLPLWIGFGVIMPSAVANAPSTEVRLAGLYGALLGAFLLTARHLLPLSLQARAERLSLRREP